MTPATPADAQAQTGQVLLAILDGWGYSEKREGNAIAQARTPNFDRLWAQGPHALINTSGADVGLPPGQMGNSEVGHLNIGAGRIVVQDLPRINAAIESGALKENPALRNLIERLRESGGVCHLMGLVSDGGVHSMQAHCVALASLLDEANVHTIVHALTDGRDTPPRSGARFIAELAQALPRSATIGTVVGRYYAMDRDKRWERVSKAYAAILDADGARFDTAADAIAAAYAENIGDEFVLPSVIDGYSGMRNGDALLCFNFRPDRVREILGALLDAGFAEFERPRLVNFVAAIGLTQYSERLANLMESMFGPEQLSNVLGEVIADRGLRQLRIAETEKYAHITYFLNGGREEPYPGEERILVPSPRVPTYDLQPEMSAPEVTKKLIEAIAAGKYDLMVVNYANPDMVGHTGDIEAAIKAIETVDAALGALDAALERVGGVMLVTADHGNCESMRDKDGGVHTAHTTNPVPVLLSGRNRLTLRDGRLSDIAPTVLELMAISRPAEMTGNSLIMRASESPTHEAAQISTRAGVRER
jgi:2,3-bisphosphoglycerate-independent phosphoglycerate mutase